MSSSSANAHLIWPLLMRPTLAAIQKHNPQAARNLALALGNAENSDPGLLLELVSLMLNEPSFSASLNSSSLTESLLRAQSLLSADLTDFTNRTGSNVKIQNLFNRTHILKQLLSRIPVQINQRNAFLQTIKEIASAIKRVLDCMDQLQLTNNRPVDQRKRQLVRDSKAFSQTLKAYFKGDAQPEALFASSVQLIYDLNMIEKVTATTSSSTPSSIPTASKSAAK